MNRRPQQQLTLDLGAQVGAAEQLHDAYRQLDLDRAGIAFDRVMHNAAAAAVLIQVSHAFQRGHPTAARAYARRIVTMKEQLK